MTCIVHVFAMFIPNLHIINVCNLFRTSTSKPSRITMTVFIQCFQLTNNIRFDTAESTNYIVMNRNKTQHDKSNRQAQLETNKILNQTETEATGIIKLLNVHRHSFASTFSARRGSFP